MQYEYVYDLVYAFIPLTKKTAAQNEIVLSYHRVRVLYFLTFVFVAIISYALDLNVTLINIGSNINYSIVWKQS